MTTEGNHRLERGFKIQSDRHCTSCIASLTTCILDLDRENKGVGTVNSKVRKDSLELCAKVSLMWKSNKGLRWHGGVGTKIMVLMLSEIQVRICMNTILRNEVDAKMSTSISLDGGGIHGRNGRQRWAH